jgi:RNA polymerase sigma-70 factor (family 1)
VQLILVSNYVKIDLKLCEIKMFHLRTYTDDELLKGLHEGDIKAFEIIFDKYWYPLFKIANARLQSASDAEEIVQDIFTALWKNRNTTIISVLSHYLFSAVRKRTISAMRSKMMDQKYRNYCTQFFSDRSLATDETVEFDELKDTIEKVLQLLPLKSQQVFRLNRLQGVSIPEISELLKTPRRTIEYHLTKALRELRFYLKDYILLLPFLFT